MSLLLSVNISLFSFKQITFLTKSFISKSFIPALLVIIPPTLPGIGNKLSKPPKLLSLSFIIKFFNKYPDETKASLLFI